MDDSPAPPATPEPVDPAAPPKRVVRAASVALLVSVLMLLLGARVAGRESGPYRGQPPISAGTFLDVSLLALLAGVLLGLTYLAIARHRLRRYERLFGFLPREGRKELPRTGRETLVRVEYGSEGGWLCLMLTRWDHGRSGWHRGRVLEQAWVRSDDAVAIGEQRASLSGRAETLEDDLDNARLAAEGERELADECSAEERVRSTQSHQLAENLARDTTPR